jgi:hypothetical protein
MYFYVDLGLNTCRTRLQFDCFDTMAALSQLRLISLTDHFIVSLGEQRQHIFLF